MREAARAETPRVPRPRRGRPFRLPDDPTPLRAATADATPRVAWLLATSRVHHPDPERSGRRGFCERLSELGVPADQARVSRWESGARRLPSEVLAGYERVLGLADGRLTAVAHSVQRAFGTEEHESSAVADQPPELHAELDELFEAILADGPGQDLALSWVRLSELLTRGTAVYLRPPTWAQLTDRLARELPRAVGIGYVRRCEALRLLLRHEPSRKHALRSIGAVVTDPDTHMVSQPLALLAEVDDPQATALLLKAMAGRDALIYRGAAWAAARKLATGRLDPAETADLAAATLRLAQRPLPLVPDVFVLDLAAQLPWDAAQRLLTDCAGSPLLPRLQTAVDEGLLAPGSTARGTARRLVTDVTRAMPSPSGMEPDVLLERLLLEALFHAHQERRHQAGLLLAASPYRGAVARSLSHLVEDESELHAQRALALMLYLGGEEQRQQLLRWSADDARPRRRMRALLTLAHLREPLSAAEEELLLEGLRRGTDPAVRRAHLYALGMHRAACLAALSEDPDDYVGRAARWWRRTGGALHDPVPADAITT